jgi:uncharacterized protein
MTNLRYTLITGSSQGFGKALAQECARRGMNLILADFDSQALHNTAEEIRLKYSVTVHSLEFQSEKGEAAATYLYKWCESQGYIINMLINNMSQTLNRNFCDTTLADISGLIQYNINSSVAITHLLLKKLQQQPKAYILNVAGLSAYHPLVGRSVYSAAKAFIVSLSKTLARELSDTSVEVAVVCPNDTNNIEDQRTAKAAIDGLLNGRTAIVVGFKNKFKIYTRRLFY